MIGLQCSDMLDKFSPLNLDLLEWEASVIIA